MTYIYVRHVICPPSGAFVIYLTVGGVLRTFGIFMVEFLADYDTDSATSSLIIGLQFATSGVVGMFRIKAKKTGTENSNMSQRFNSLKIIT